MGNVSSRPPMSKLLCPHLTVFCGWIFLATQEAAYSLLFKLLSFHGPLLLFYNNCFPSVFGDCFDEPPTNQSYDNCANCFQTFANALINTGGNKYELSRMVFPIGVKPAVQVQVTYSSNLDTVARSLVWHIGGFYVFQPLEFPLSFTTIFTSTVVPRIPKLLVSAGLGGVVLLTLGTHAQRGLL